MTNKKLSCC